MLLGVEIGGTKLQAAVVARGGLVRQLLRVPVDRARGRSGILEQLREIVPPLLRQQRITAIGVGFGGPVDVIQGRVLTSHQIKGWRGFRLRDWFVETFDRPTVVENDSHCAALAEARHGAGQQSQRVFYFNVGTGIGGGWVVAGQLDTGRFGAMEFGHTRLHVAGQWRTLESVASGLAIERGVSTVTQAGRHVGAALANVLTLLNPQIVVVGGGVASAGEKFLRPVRETAKRLGFQPYRNNYRIVPAQLGDQAVVIGATLVAGASRRARIDES